MTEIQTQIEVIKRLVIDGNTGLALLKLEELEKAILKYGGNRYVEGYEGANGNITRTY